MKKYTLTIIMIIMIIGILGYSIFLLWPEEKSITKDDVQYTTKVNIDDLVLDIKFLESNLLDEEISYGNKVTKIIEVKNNNDVPLTFALSLDKVRVDNEDLSYTLGYSDTKNGFYENIGDSGKVLESMNLGYNLVCDKNSKIYIKVEFKANKEGVQTSFKGILNVISNLSEKDVFINSLMKFQDALNNKIKSLNGINISGVYMFNINALPDNVRKNYHGYIVVDATDISNLEYIYTIWNDKLIINNHKLSNKTNKNHIESLKNYDVNSLNATEVCRNYTKKGCSSFNNLKYDKLGGKDNFVLYSKKVINLVKNDFKEKALSKQVYIYDITQDIRFNNVLKLKGYILIDNTKENAEYYIYIASNLFMVSGYNMTKLGEYDASSSTIRAYRDSTYNLSSSSIDVVCKFSGFNECYDIHNNLIKVS